MITILADEKVCNLGQAISAELAQANHDIKYFSLQNMNIKLCYACRGCEEKTYRRCIVRDDADLILPYLVRSNTIIAVMPITYGSYSFQMKRIIDKFALLIDIYYRYKNGELIKGISLPGVQFYAVGVHNQAEQAEIQAFEFLVKETLKITDWNGKPIIVSSYSPDLSSIIKEVML